MATGNVSPAVDLNQYMLDSINRRGAPTIKPAATTESAPASVTVPTGAPSSAPLQPETTTKTGDPQAGYNVEQIGFNPVTDSVANVARELSESGSPLMQMSDTQVKQRANSMGILNSTMTQQAMEAGRLSQAVPIASADVRNRLDARIANVAAINRSREVSTLGKQAIEQINRRGEIDKELQVADAASRMALIREQGAIDMSLANQRAEHIRLQALEQEKIDTRIQERKKEIDLEITKAAGEQNILLQQEKGRLDVELADRQAEAALNLQTKVGEINTQLEAVRNTYRLGEIQKANELEAILQNQKIEAEKEIQRMVGIQRLEELGISKQNSLDLQKLQNDNATLLQASQSAAQTFTTHSAAIAQIMAQPDMPANVKQNLIDQQVNLLRSSLKVIGGVAGHNFDQYLNFTPPGVLPPGAITTLPVMPPGNITVPGMPGGNITLPGTTATGTPAVRYDSRGFPIDTSRLMG